jgi:hypothetical protein
MAVADTVPSATRPIPGSRRFLTGRAERGLGEHWHASAEGSAITIPGWQLRRNRTRARRDGRGNGRGATGRAAPGYSPL